MVAAAFTLTNCTQEIDAPVEPSVDGVPFEIVAKSADTKTTNDGLATVWAEGDALNLFHIPTSEAEAEAPNYILDGQFNFEADDTFKGNLASVLEEGNFYNWYAIYPYDSHVKTPASTNSGYLTVGANSYSNFLQTQTGNNSMAHIAGPNYPLAGRVTEWEHFAGEPVEIEMTHLTCLLKVVVTNKTEEDLTVSSVAFSAPDNIVGTYYLNIVGDEPYFTSSGDNYVSKTASLNVEDGEALGNGESAEFYLAVKPFDAAAGKRLVLNVNGYQKGFNLENEFSVNAGEIVTLNFSYDKKVEETTALSLPWYEDFSSADLSNYVVTNSTNSTSETKLYDTDPLVCGDAPELLIAKGNGTFTATLSTGGYSGDLTLLFKSNYPDRIAVTSPTTGVTLTKLSSLEYTVNIAAGVQNFSLVFTNTTSSNARIDNIQLVKGVLLTQTLTFATPSYSLTLGTDEANSFVGQPVQGAQTDVVYSSDNESVAKVNPETGDVELMGGEGSATITAKAIATSEYKEAIAEYLISVELPRTGEAKTYTLEITTSDFNSTSYAANNGEHTSTATAVDGSTMDVKWESNQVMFQNGVMQWQKKKGYIYNTTNLGTIEKVELKDNTGGTFTTYIGSAANPSSNGEGGFFKVSIGDATGKIQKLVVTFTK